MNCTHSSVISCTSRFPRCLSKILMGLALRILSVKILCLRSGSYVIIKVWDFFGVNSVVLVLVVSLNLISFKQKVDTIQCSREINLLTLNCASKPGSGPYVSFTFTLGLACAFCFDMLGVDDISIITQYRVSQCCRLKLNN